MSEQIDQALKTIPADTKAEIAFFGGSFTGIDRGQMLRLLDTAEAYVQAGRVRSIRLSTRPDYISPEILQILSDYSVGTIELGLQSMKDRVLERSLRGHDASTAREACRAVVESGFSLVGQMMIGLPASTPEDECDTAREICALGASAARIYPTVVFYQTPLYGELQRGAYQPLSVEEAVVRSSRALDIFLKHDVPCIRIGLCASEDLVSLEHVAAGPNHPALGELVWNHYYYQKILNAIQNEGLLGKELMLTVPRADISKAVGQHRCNLERLLRETDTRVCKIVGSDTQIGVLPTEWSHAAKFAKGAKRPCI